MVGIQQINYSKIYKRKASLELIELVLWEVLKREQRLKWIITLIFVCHDLIRLANYWNKSLFLGEYISGRSSLIKLVAIHVANKEVKVNCYLLSGFKIFCKL